MSQTQKIQELATLAAMIDPDDAPGLVALSEGLRAVSKSTDSPLDERSSAVAAKTVELVEQIVLREFEDSGDAIARVHEAIDYLQSVVDTALTPEARAALPSPRVLGQSAGPAEEPRDIELLESWIVSATDNLNSIEEHILGLKSPDSSEEARESIAAILRGVHTLKGECGVLSAREAQALCHEIESAISSLHESGKPFPSDEVIALLDWMRGYIEVLSANPNAPAPESGALLARFKSLSGAAGPAASQAGPVSSAKPVSKATKTATPDAASAPTRPQAGADEPVNLVVESDDMLMEFLGEAREHLDAAEAAALELENNPSDLELVNTIFRAFHTIKGVAGFMNLKPIVELAHSAEFLLDAVRSETITLIADHLNLILAASDALRSMISALDGGKPPLRRAVDELIELLERARKGESISGAALASRSRTAPPPAAGQPAGDADASDDSEPEAPAQTPQQSQTHASRRPDQTIKVNTGRLDSLVDMVGELVISQQMVVQDPSIRSVSDQRTQRNLVQVGKIIRDLQEVAMSLRMVTVRGTFQKMARLVRDVSLKAGKSINFMMEGEDTELDRNVVDVIGDPLVHMVRNACDHGIETAEQRRAAGKPEMGNLTLRAFHKGGSIVIEIEDDGRGLSREKILKKAIERGIYTPDRDVNEIPDSEVYNLVFLPGFSTADKVTDISGRGVGMDVVRRNIESLRGKVEIRSTPGQGSTFMMRLPLTMAIIDGMVVRVGSQRYVVPTLAIEQSFRPAKGQITTIVERGEAAMVRGSLLPIYRLNRLFDLHEGKSSFEDTLLVVLESNNSRCCLMVDEILGQQQVVIKSLGTGVGQLRGVSGGAILGDGRVALILDVAGLFAEATGDARSPQPSRVA